MRATPLDPPHRLLMGPGPINADPRVLRAAFPNLLVNGAGGIPVGMATNIPTHNPTEVIDATLALSRVPLTRANLRGLLLRLPMMTLKTVLAIYWQALRLWLKRVPLYNHPVSRSERS